jgi:hypothetical protein
MKRMIFVGIAMRLEKLSGSNLFSAINKLKK